MHLRSLLSKQYWTTDITQEIDFLKSPDDTSTMTLFNPLIVLLPFYIFNVIFLSKSNGSAHIRKIPNEVKLALQARMSQILFQIWDKLGLDDFEFDVTLLQTREAKVFASVVVLVPVAYCVVETCRFLWKIRYGNTLLSKCFMYNPVSTVQDFLRGALKLA